MYQQKVHRHRFSSFRISCHRHDTCIDYYLILLDYCFITTSDASESVEHSTRSTCQHQNNYDMTKLANRCVQQCRYCWLWDFTWLWYGQNPSEMSCSLSQKCKKVNSLAFDKLTMEHWLQSYISSKLQAQNFKGKFP